jgi:hypothetical protein
MIGGIWLYKAYDKMMKQSVNKKLLINESKIYFFEGLNFKWKLRFNAKKRGDHKTAMSN